MISFLNKFVWEMNFLTDTGQIMIRAGGIPIRRFSDLPRQGTESKTSYQKGLMASFPQQSHRSLLVGSLPLALRYIGKRLNLLSGFPKQQIKPVHEQIAHGTSFHSSALLELFVYYVCLNHLALLLASFLFLVFLCECTLIIQITCLARLFCFALS